MFLLFVIKCPCFEDRVVSQTIQLFFFIPWFGKSNVLHNLSISAHHCLSSFSFCLFSVFMQGRILHYSEFFDVYGKEATHHYYPLSMS